MWLAPSTIVPCLRRNLLIPYSRALVVSTELSASIHQIKVGARVIGISGTQINASTSVLFLERNISNHNYVLSKLYDFDPDA